MTSSLAGTVAHGARGGRGVSTSHFCRIFPGLSGTPRYSPELPGSGSHNILKAYACFSSIRECAVWSRELPLGRRHDARIEKGMCWCLEGLEICLFGPGCT